MSATITVPTPPAELRARLAGTRGLLVDLDGVLILRGEAIQGSVGAMAALDRLEIPYRILTNTSLMSRRTLAAQAETLGFNLAPERIVSALSATAAYTRRAFYGRPLYVLAAPDARREFAGQWLVSHAEADRPELEVAAVVVGDSPEELSYPNVDRAFRFLHRGAPLIAMHRNRWWLTARGPTIDAGAYVAGLEFAAGVTATVLGKPSLDFFREAAAELAEEIGGRSARPDAAADTGERAGSGAGPSVGDAATVAAGAVVAAGDMTMVGDDLLSDVAAGLAAGLRGVLVLTGKHGPVDVEAAARGEPPAAGAPIAPTAVAASLAAVVEALAG